MIDYYKWYLLALHLAASYSAPEVNRAIDLAGRKPSGCTARCRRRRFW
ncbi:MAG TPA: hypothetical protein VNL74_11790 [Methylococcus sp.]|nr:hypothetical protein [Methylococcus sp.]